MLMFFVVLNNTAGFLGFNNPDVSDAGSYTCRSKRNDFINATAILRVTGVLITNEYSCIRLLYCSTVFMYV